MSRNQVLTNSMTESQPIPVASRATALATSHSGGIAPLFPSASPLLERCRLWWRSLLRLSRRPERRLRLRENLALGERRFVAVIEFEEERFLIGGTSASLVLLARLEARQRGDQSMPSQPAPSQAGGRA
jgi:Flagellar biosynthesis protein, FliO